MYIDEHKSGNNKNQLYCSCLSECEIFDGPEWILRDEPEIHGEVNEAYRRINNDKCI